MFRFHEITSAHRNLMEGGHAAHVDDSTGAEGAFKQGEFVVVSRHNGTPHMVWFSRGRKITIHLIKNL